MSQQIPSLLTEGQRLMRLWIENPTKTSRVLRDLTFYAENSENLVYEFTNLLFQTLVVLRCNALNGKADTWLETVQYRQIFTQLPGVDLLIQDKATVDRILRTLKRWHIQSLDGEMDYCVEAEFIKGIRETLTTKHEAFQKEKRRRFALWHEDLIATVMRTERIVRLAEAAKMDFIDYLEAI